MNFDCILVYSMEIMEKISVPASGNAQDRVYSALRSSIINLNLAPGTTISETELSQKFQVSRTPVREALIRLSKEGLVEVIPQKETLISLIDPARVKQEFFLRESLETAVLEPFIQNGESRHFAELERLTHLQSEALKSDAFADFIIYDDRFHQILFEGAGQHLSWIVLSNMIGHYHRLRMLTIHIAGIGEEKIGEHCDICSALKEKDRKKAKDMLYNHLHGLENEEDLVKRTFHDFFLPETAKSSFEVDFGGLPIR